MLSNTCPPRFTATAGTKLVGTSLLGTTSSSSPTKGLYNPKITHHPRDIAGSSLRSLSNIPHCCLLMEPGSCLIPSVADHTLISAKDLRLGKLLPYQLPNPTRAHPKTITIFILYQIYLVFYTGIKHNIPNLWADSHALLTRTPLKLFPLKKDKKLTFD